MNSGGTRSPEKPRPTRWWMLGAFFLANALPEFLWSNFPPIMTVVAEKYGIGAVAASLPIISFSIGTMLSAGVAGRLIDRRGYGLSMRIGLGMLAVCAVLRMLDGPFWLLVLAQGGIGAAFSFIVASTSSYVVDWFDERHESLVTGICMIGLYLGLGSSMIITPLLVSAYGFHGMMRITAGAAVLIFLLGSPCIGQHRALRRSAHTAARGDTWLLMKNRALLLQFVISFLQQGAFGAVATALEIAWSHRGFSMEDAGMANGLFIFGGILGSFLMPLLQNRLRDGKRVLVACYLAALLLTYPLFAAPTPALGYVIAVIMGIFWLGSVPVALTLIEKAAGAERAGAASGLYWAYASAGSVAVVWLVSEVVERWSWQAGVAATLLLLLFNQMATFALPREPASREPVQPAGSGARGTANIVATCDDFCNEEKR
jgi:MFS transporter, FLVCR family, feline leukemia virus subgroup C receptor-related protein